MTKIGVIFDKGVFRPTEPVALPEGTKAVVEVDRDAAEMSAEELKTLTEWIDRVQASARLKGIPDDGGTSHDKYLYGEDPS
ncbi:MAG TPA: antitoxin family protein [Tepidisphaeraceae bacterium]|nr:antitoxin family protein [Tepidisphaeraceae bacterium]